MNFNDIKAQYNTLKAEIDQGISIVLNHGQFIMGPEVGQLEQMLCEFTGRKHCITCANGTDALQLLFIAYSIGSGDAVFCPDMTFIASVEPACMLGAVPVLCDIDRHTYNICPESLKRQIEAVLTEGIYRPRAVVVVDFIGNPADYEILEKICEEHRLILIEDAAQGFGAEYKGKKCTTFGHAATTSFFPSKPLGCYGDGGAVFTDDDKLAEILRSLRVHGQGPEGKYANIRIGMNSRLDTLQAAILIPKLEALQKCEIDARQRIAKRYDVAFAGHFVTPFVAEGALSVYAQYALLAKDECQRNEIVTRLKEQNIPVMIYYPTPQHLLPVFRDAPVYGEMFVNSIDYCKRTFSLPMHPYLEAAEQDRIINIILQT